VSELELVPFRVLIDRVTSSVRRHFKTMLLPAAVPLAACSILLGLMQLRWIGNLSEIERGNFEPGFFLWYFGMVFLTVLFYGLVFNAVMVAAMDSVAQRPVSMGRAWGFVLHPWVILTLVVVTILTGIAALFCFLPALYVGPALTFTLPVMADERKFGADAIRRSWELTNFNPTKRLGGYPWLQVAGILFIGWILTYVLTLVIQMPFLVAQQVILFRDVAQGEAPDMASAMSQQLWLQIPGGILGSFATVVAWMYQAFALCVLFDEVRRRKEGRDLEEAIGELVGPADEGGASQPPPTP
jgi:hypothetical protein